MQPPLNPDLLGCPLYRRLMPRKISESLVEIAFILIVGGLDFGAIWLIESREIRASIDTAKNIGMYFLVFAFTLVCLLLMVYAQRRSRQEYRKRGERLSRITTDEFWALDAEVSMSELQYGSFYFLKKYLYAPGARLLIRYEDIATWQFGDFFSAVSGTLEKQFLDIVEQDGFKTQILIKDRARLVREQDQVKVRLNYYIMKAKYPKGSPYRNA